MTVDSRALVEPSRAIAGIDPNHNAVVAANGDEIGDVVTEGRVAAFIAAEIAAIDEDQDITESSIELDGESLAGVGCGNIKLPAVPTNTRLGIFAANGLESVGCERVVPYERQLDTPIVRQLQRPPFGVVEPDFRKLKTAGLGEDFLILAKAQVAVRIVGIAQLEIPSKVEEQLLARRNGRRGCREARLRNAGQQSCRVRPRGPNQERRRGESQSGAKQIAARDTRHKSPLSNEDQLQASNPFTFLLNRLHTRQIALAVRYSESLEIFAVS